MVIVIVAARVDLLGRFDDGIEYTSVTYLLHGQIPYTDFYEPYGIGLGIPGVLPHLVGINSVFALRLVYGLFPPLVTLLVTPFVWRRCGGPIAILVGLVTITSTTPRYSIGFAALIGFALLVDRAVRRTAGGTLQEAAERYPRELLAASAVCSLAGWIRDEYAIFAVTWAVVLLIVLPPGRRHRTLVLGTLLAAALPSLIVLVTGGLQHLWWFVSYTISSAPSGFHAQRGQPIEWHLLTERLNELWHLNLGPSTAATIVSSYGVGLLAVLAGVAILLVPPWRRSLVARDRSYLTPLMILACALVLYGQAARFSTAYGSIGNPVFWLTAALLLGRAGRGAVLGLLLVLAYPLLTSIAPGSVYDMWAARPPVDNRVVVPGFNHIPMAEDGGPAAMAALISQWRTLGLDGRPTVDVELRNDSSWANDAIVGYLLNAPAAAWPLTYDPGLFNSAKVERETIAELCANHAPVVQNDGDVPYPPGKTPYVGSRLLDEFLAVNYQVKALAGFYRILLPTATRCLAVARIDDRELEALGEGLLARGEVAEAGALAIARLERAEARHETRSGADELIAALGGYTLSADQLPAGMLGGAVRTLIGGPAGPDLAAAAAYPWPSEAERLAAQTAWVGHRSAGEAGTPQAAAAVLALALRHADWPQAISNVSAVQPPTPSLFARLERGGARGISEFDHWRRGYFVEAGDVPESIGAGLALIADYGRQRDPVDAGQAEAELAEYTGVSPGCAYALRHHADTRPGVRIVLPPGGAACTQRQLLEAGY
jgi:hypothetical protein